jgi:hypothetical protein
MGHNRRYGDPLTALDAPAVPPPARIRPQHVWVNLSTVQHAPAVYPGVLIEWRPVVKGWEALCTWASPDGVVHTGWLPAARLTPVKC